jgi:hypothetical protein
MAGDSSCWEKSEKIAKRLRPELTPESHAQAFYRPFGEHLEY